MADEANQIEGAIVLHPPRQLLEHTPANPPMKGIPFSLLVKVDGLVQPPAS